MAFGSPFLPLPAFLFFGTQDESAETGGEIAVGQVLGRAGSFSTAGCAKATDTREGVGQSEGIAVTPIPDDGLGANSGKTSSPWAMQKRVCRGRQTRQGKLGKMNFSH
jgi:hypothetical protein